MTKADLVQEISDKTGIARDEVLSIIETFMVEVKESLQKGEEVTLRGFGGFFMKHKAAKTARNISKNTTMIVPEHYSPAFKPAKEFIDLLKK